ncbi:MAG: glycosyltransferase [Elusimicrobiales bacterium]|nr:glycosyltransferase [Elusimicrobiales bacterium]
MAKPVVVHIITRLEAGGSSRNTLDSCAAQAAEYDVVLIAGPHRDAAALLKLTPAVNYIEVKGLQREVDLFRDFSALLELRRELSRLEPDIIHTHTSKAGALGRLAAALAGFGKKRKAIVIHTPHGHLLYGYYGPLRTFLFKTVERILALFTDYLIALTPGELRETSAAGIGAPRRWRVVHSGVDLRPPAVPAHKRTLGVAEDEIAVGTVARLEPVKGVEYFIKAAAILKRRRPGLKLKFVVIGGGALEAGLRGLAGGLGLGDDLIFTGFRADAAALMAALDIYAQPSLNEAMGRAPLEAQALGVPAVVTRVCGLPDVIKEGETGFAVPPADPEALAGALERLVMDKALRERMGAAAKAWTLAADETGFARFGADSMNAKLKAFYAEALAARGKPED